MSAAVSILIKKLLSAGEEAEHAADALIVQARRHKSKLDTEVENISAHLRHPNFSVRAAVSKVLGQIGTARAIDAIVKAIISTPEHELKKKCGYKCWSDEPLHYWFISSISETENAHAAQALVLLINSDSLPKTAKSLAMKELSGYDLDEYEVTLPENIVEVLEHFASSTDAGISEGAIKLLGRV